jgi:hypothetical protein
VGFIENAASDIADTDKMVISVWFKIPQEAITAAIAQYNDADGGNDDSNMHGIIPLVSFGVPSAVDGGPTPFTSRCFIGVSCGHYEFSDYADELPLPDPHLFVYLQYDNGTNENLGISTFDFFQVGGNISYFFAPGDLPLGEDIIITPLTVSPDEWHHALVSFDMSGGCSMTSTVDIGRTSFNGTACELWWALDDVNYDGDSLWPSNWSVYEDADTGGANDIVSAGVLIANATETDPDILHSFAAGNLPISGNPMGIPASTADATDHVYNIYMSELQIFTGVSLDTSVLANRRAFITAAGRPAAPSLAAALLGKSPEIHFQTHTDFIEGNNRGTADDFDPTGTIIGYTPGP